VSVCQLKRRAALLQNVFRVVGDFSHLLSFFLIFYKIYESKNVKGTMWPDLLPVCTLAYGSFNLLTRCLVANWQVSLSSRNRYMSLSSSPATSICCGILHPCTTG
jgi:hypothetical protein